MEFYLDMMAGKVHSFYKQHFMHAQSIEVICVLHDCDMIAHVTLPQGWKTCGVV